MASRHKPSEPGTPALGDPELAGAGAGVRVIELKSSGEDAEKGEKPLLRVAGKHRGPSFPWSVRVPLNISPRLRGLILLNLVRRRRPPGMPRPSLWCLAAASLLPPARSAATAAAHSPSQQLAVPLLYHCQPNRGLAAAHLTTLARLNAASTFPPCPAGLPGLRIGLCGAQGVAGGGGPLRILLCALCHRGCCFQPLHPSCPAG